MNYKTIECLWTFLLYCKSGAVLLGIATLCVLLCFELNNFLPFSVDFSSLTSSKCPTPNFLVSPVRTVRIYQVVLDF